MFILMQLLDHQNLDALPIVDMVINSIVSMYDGVLSTSKYSTSSSSLDLQMLFLLLDIDSLFLYLLPTNCISSINFKSSNICIKSKCACCTTFWSTLLLFLMVAQRNMVKLIQSYQQDLVFHHFLL